MKSGLIAVILLLGTMSLFRAPDARAADEGINVKLQSFLQDAKKRLGPLEPWQNRLFEEEVMTQPKRFIRDYRASAKGVEAVADIESIRKYLRFYGPRSLKRENPQILVVVRAERGCAKCAASVAGVRSVVKTRLERRGLGLIWAQPRELSLAIQANGGTGGASGGHTLLDALDELAIQKGAVGALLVESVTAPVDAIDTAHADEAHFLVKSALVIRDLGKEEEQIDLLDNGDMEKSAAKLLTDAFTGVGDKLERLQANQSDLNRGEFLVEVTGFEDYAQYIQAKDQIAHLLSGTSSVEEQRVSRGKAIFAIYTEARFDQVRAQLASMNPELGEGQILRIQVSAMPAVLPVKPGNR